MKIGLLLSKENIELSTAEAEIIIADFLKGSILSKDQNLLIAEVPEPINKEFLKRTAYAKLAVSIELETNKPEELETNLLKGQLKPSEQEFNLKKKNSFRITKLNLIHSQRDFLDVKKIASGVWNYRFIGQVNLENPEMDFHIIKGKKNYLGLKLWENEDKFMERRADKRPANHPTAMSPRLAKALINLAGAKKEVLDPFCGAGGILIEAGLLGLETKGLDIDKEMIERARKNLEFFKINNFELHEQNALEWTKKAECVVTDVPYGKSSKLKTDLYELIDELLEKYEKLTDKIVITHPSTINIDQILKSKSWKKKKEISIIIHSSLTRKIVKLEK